MSEEQTPYETELAQVADEQRADAHWPRVSVTISGTAFEPCKRLADLVKHIMGEGREADAQEAGAIRIVGYVDGPIEDFLSKLELAQAEVARLADAMHDSEDDRYKAQLQADENLAIVDALAKRLAEVEGRKLALAVAHGDIAPEAYESRRKVVADSVGQIIGAVRAGFRQRVNSKDGAQERR